MSGAACKSNIPCPDLSSFPELVDANILPFLAPLQWRLVDITNCPRFRKETKAPGAEAQGSGPHEGER